MESSKILAFHELPAGFTAEIDNIPYSAVYHDSYLGERITLLENFAGHGRLAVEKQQHHIPHQAPQRRKAAEELSVHAAGACRPR